MNKRRVTNKAKRILCLIMATLYILSIINVAGFSVFADESNNSGIESSDEKMSEKSLEVYPDEEDQERVIKLDGMMPEDASAEAFDVTDKISEYLNNELQEEDESLDISSMSDGLSINENNDNKKSAETGTVTDASIISKDKAASDKTDLSKEVLSGATDVIKEDSLSIVAAYDITIYDGESEFQPEEDEPIDVEITNPEIRSDATYKLWHIKDDGESEEVTDFTVTDGCVCFKATGFSVYEVVEVAEPEEITYEEVQTIDEFESGSFLLYIKNKKGTPVVPYYFCDSIVVKGTQTYIKKSNDIKYAATWNFHKADDGKFYISTKIMGVDKYMKMTKAGDNGWMSLEEDIDQATAFDVSYFADNTPGSFYISLNGCGLNMHGEVPGNGFAGWGGKDSRTDAGAKVVALKIPEKEDDEARIDGKTYGLVIRNGNNNGAMLSDEKIDGDKRRLKAISLKNRIINVNGDLVLDSTDDITLWTFDNISGSSYYITTEIDGVIKYLKITDKDIYLQDTPDEYCRFNVEQGTGKFSGKIRITNIYGMSPNLISGTVNNGFGPFNNRDSATEWFSLVRESAYEEGFVPCVANKVSVSDVINVPNKKKVIIYTRVWDDTAKKYNFYIVGPDGRLITAYDCGDNIQWAGTEINTLLWEFTEYYDSETGKPNNYYELQNVYTGKYLAPLISGSTFLSDKPIGLNLNGRTDEEYGTQILAWDEIAYNYASIINSTGNITSGSMNNADDYYFAIIEDVQDEFTYADTIDNKEYGITMKMVDFNGPNISVPDKKTEDKTENKDRNAKQAEVMGTESFYYQSYADPKKLNKEPLSGLLSNELVTEGENEGYPTAIQTGKSLKELFGDAVEVNHLFLKNTHEESGYFEYNCTQNYAYLDGTDFKVYNQVGTTSSGKYYNHGQFFPYDKLVSNHYSKNGNTNDELTRDLDPEDPRRKMQLYQIDKPDFYFGMELEAKFVQTVSGEDAWGHDMIFEFSGDDDFWLYVDDLLIIDLGGVHDALPGSVNFKTGEVSVNGVQKPLIEYFEEAYRLKYPDATEAEVSAYLAEKFDEEGKTFKDYSTHTMKLFYMERGGGASNLHLKFNLSSVTPGSVTLSKEVTGSQDVDYNMVEYPYQIWYQEDENQQWKLLSNDNEWIGVRYQVSNKKVDYKPTYTPPGDEGIKTYDSVYFLQPGKPAQIYFPDNIYKYKIVECAVNNEVYSKVYFNNDLMTRPSDHIPGNENRYDYETSEATVVERPNAAFKNEVDPEGLRTLTFEKRLFNEKSKTNRIHDEDDDTKFSFRLYIGREDDETLNLAYMVKYRVKNAEGMYCKWDSTTQSFASLGKDDFEDLTAEQKLSATFTTSINGQISRIPVDYKILVPGLPVGAKFKVVENVYDTPVGYELIDYDCDRSTFKVDDITKKNSGTVIPKASPYMWINNCRGYGLTAKKVWSDENYIKSHDPIYTAVYKESGGVKTLVPGTVKQFTHPYYSVRYFLENIEGDLSDYNIYEVDLKNPVVGADGVVTYDDIEISDGQPITIKAVPKNKTEANSYSYVSTYKRGEPAKSVDTLNYNNIREDIITNTRSGGVVVTLYDMETNEKLSGGKFKLTASDGTDLGEYTADENGRITVIYDFDRDEEYTITQIEAPGGYIGLPNPAKFTIKSDDEIEISGNEDKWQKGRRAETSGDNLVAYIDLYNKPFSFKILKVDSAAGTPLQGAEFDLYRAIEVKGVMKKDYSPIQNYVGMVSDSSGVVLDTEDLSQPGTYYITETKAPKGYKIAKEDIVFTISKEGISVPAEYSTYLTTTENAQKTAYEYVISVPNTRKGADPILTVEKQVSGNMGNKFKDFTFTFTTSEGDTTEYSWTKNGVAQTTPLKSGDTFELKSKDVVKIVVSAGTEVTIREESAGIEDYTTTFKLNNDSEEENPDRIKTFTVNQDTTLLVKNTREALIPTGVWMPVSMMIGAGIVILLSLVILRKRSKKLKDIMKI
ncbi:MAG: hypothetical protein K5865_01065 [Eubacterium sp.]|nr:hypothetical protein [Eubacterium sp.]